MEIRPETPADYAAITRVNVLAFEQRASEAMMIAALRLRAEFDPELSLVAVMDGGVVGHVLFSPFSVRLLGEEVRAVNLAPLAVLPDWQHRGVGAALIEEGHDRARRLGFAFSFLLGHPSYYPRFGYLPGAYGAATVRMAMAEPPPARLESRPPQADDLPALQMIWEREEGGVDFAVFPGEELLDWLSPNPAMAPRVWLRDGVVIGYTRAMRSEPLTPRAFYAEDEFAAVDIARGLAAFAGGGAPVVELPLHPASRSAGAFGKPDCQAWAAAMVCPLTTSPFDEYYRQVRAGSRTPGRVVWHSAFDFD